MSRLAADRGVRTIWIDGRDVRPFPGEVDAVSPTSSRLVGRSSCSTCELIESLGSHLRDHVIPELPESTLVVLASTAALSRLVRAGRGVGPGLRAVHATARAAATGSATSRLVTIAAATLFAGCC